MRAEKVGQRNGDSDMEFQEGMTANLFKGLATGMRRDIAALGHVPSNEDVI